MRKVTHPGHPLIVSMTNMATLLWKTLNANVVASAGQNGLSPLFVGYPAAVELNQRNARFWVSSPIRAHALRWYQP